MRLHAAIFLAIVPSGAARAQSVDLTVPDPIAQELTDVRLSHQLERREAGIVLATGGLASVIGGAAIAGAGYEDPFWLAFGLGSIAWGAINAALAIGMLDLGDGGMSRIRGGLELRGDELADAREDALRAQHSTATVFAVNFGLDVFYIASGILLFFLADQIEADHDAQLLRGYSAAMIGQGTFLFAFDLVEWIASNTRADRIGRIERPR
jgi:hypothetical protein